MRCMSPSRGPRAGDVMIHEATMDDPVAFTKSRVITPQGIQNAGLGEELVETICTASVSSERRCPDIR